MPPQIRHVRFEVQLAAMVFAGSLPKTLVAGKVVGVFSGPMTPEVILRVDSRLTRWKRTLLSVSSPVLVKSVQIGESPAAGTVRAFTRIRRPGVPSRYCRHLHVSKCITRHRGQRLG
jgi:hypothetical protein